MIMSHNNIRDAMANLLREVCHDVKVEPQLQKVNEGDCLNLETVTGDQARFDVSARGVWTPFDKTFLDIRVFTPQSNRTKTLQVEKQITLNVKKASFTPAVFLTTGGMSKECKRFVNRVADLIARKRKERYCNVVRHVRTRIRFAMLVGNRGKKIESKHETPLSEVSHNHIYIIFVSFKLKNISNNGPLLLIMYCALPIASLDLIECIYCLNDPFSL